jgi:predicted Zn-dependent peptidase
VQLVELASGQRALLLPKHDLPLVRFGVLVPAGIERSPLQGLSLFAALMFEQGTGSCAACGPSAANLDAARLSSRLATLGARLSIRVERDNLELWVTAHRQQIAAAIQLLATILRAPRFAKPERARVHAELSSKIRRKRVDPVALADTAVRQALFADGPNSLVKLPSSQALRSLSLSALRRFHHDRLRSMSGRKTALERPVRFIAAGQIRLRELVRWTKPFAALFAKREPATSTRSSGPTAAANSAPSGRSHATQAPSRAAARSFYVSLPDASQMVLRLGIPTVGWAHRDFVGVRLLMMALAGTFTGRLNQRVREQIGATYGVTAEIFEGPKSSVISIGASIEPTASRRVVQIFEQEVQRLASAPPCREELRKVRLQLAQEIFAGAESVAGLGRIGRFVRRRLSPTQRAVLPTKARQLDTLKQQLTRLNNVSCQSLAQLAKTLQRNARWVFVGPPAHIPQRRRQNALKLDPEGFVPARELPANR